LLEQVIIENHEPIVRVVKITTPRERWLLLREEWRSSAQAAVVLMGDLKVRKLL
jgi:hypothetical protein